ncbi:MAG: hypothetical protein HGA75_17585 [Thiobacillus sp.]|nr:hypothetical protein [Thiobacillus sp.]
MPILKLSPRRFRALALVAGLLIPMGVWLSQREMPARAVLPVADHTVPPGGLAEFAAAAGQAIKALDAMPLDGFDARPATVASAAIAAAAGMRIGAAANNPGSGRAAESTMPQEPRVQTNDEEPS